MGNPIYQGRNVDPENEIEAFLAVVFEPAFKLEGIEWADWDPGPVEAPKDRNVADGGKLEPGLVRVRCKKCGEEKDAWVGENGHFEDPRDRYHKHNEGDVYYTEVVPDGAEDAS